MGWERIARAIRKPGAVESWTPAEPDSGRHTGLAAPLGEAVHSIGSTRGVDELAEEIQGVLAAGSPVFSLETVAKVGLPGELAAAIVMEQPTAALLAKAWLALSPEDRSKRATQPVQPAYLRPPHVTEAKGGHPLLRK